MPKVCVPQLSSISPEEELIGTRYVALVSTLNSLDYRAQLCLSTAILTSPEGLSNPVLHFRTILAVILQIFLMHHGKLQGTGGLTGSLQLIADQWAAPEQ
jgi:hypothetical protein